MPFLVPVITVATCFATGEALSMYKINRRMNNARLKEAPKILKYNNDLELNLSAIKDKYSKYIDTFYEEMKSNNSGIDLNNFVRNANRLILINNNKKHPTCSAVFYHFDDCCYIVLFSEDNLNLSIYHELMHMASSRYINDIRYTGFRQSFENKRKMISIGEGLNEGYTEWITVKYFHKHGKNEATYPALTNIARLLEVEFIGEELMEKYYFDSDLPSLIHALEYYDTRENIMRFIKDLDFIRYYKPNPLSVYEKIKYDTVIRDVKSLLTKWFSFKLREYVDSGEIKINECGEYAGMFAREVSFSPEEIYIAINGEDYNQEEPTQFTLEK